MRFLVYPLISIILVLLGILFTHDVAALIVLGALSLAFSLWLVWPTATPMLRVTFAALACHAVIGWMVAEPSASAIWIGTGGAQLYATAFFVVSLGLLAGAFGFSIANQRQLSLPTFDEDRFRVISRRLALLGAGGMFVVYYSLHALPWQIDLLTIGSTRYITGITEWVINRFMDLLTITVPVLFLFGKREKVYGLIGLFGLLMPFRRANIMAVLLLIAICWSIRHNRFKPLLVCIALAVSIYASSQLLYFGILARKVDTHESIAALGSALPEVRDLGWMVQLTDGHRWWGATFVQPVLPLPSFIVPWVQEHSLRSVSTRLIGLDRENTGGLRLTLAGESFLNFGFFGVLVVCFAWGLAMRWIDSAIRSALPNRRLHVYLVSLMLSWVAFWIYLGGSQASGIIKAGIGICAILLIITRSRSPTFLIARQVST